VRQRPLFVLRSVDSVLGCTMSFRPEGHEVARSGEIY